MSAQDVLALCDHIMTEVDIDLMEWQSALDRVSLAGVGVPSLELWSLNTPITPENIEEYDRRPINIVMRRVDGMSRGIGAGRIELRSREVEVSLPERVLELGAYGLKGVHTIPLRAFKGFEPAVPKLQGMTWDDESSMIDIPQARINWAEHIEQWRKAYKENNNVTG